MDHNSGAHDVPWVVKSANIEQFVPPWTVHRQVWLDSLKAGHSGISTDILLFSDINLSLVHHFRKNYLLRLRALLPLPVAQPQDDCDPTWKAYLWQLNLGRRQHQFRWG